MGKYKSKFSGQQIDDGIEYGVRVTQQTFSSAQKKQARGNIAAQETIEIVEASGTTLNAEVGKYYRFDSDVTTLTVNLPTITGATEVQEFKMYFHTPLSSTPSITFTGGTITKLGNFSIVPNSYYCVDCIWNGGAWIIQTNEPTLYDSEIEYIQSSGTQYIDTGIYGSGKIRMVAHIETMANNGQNSAFSGVFYNNYSGLWQVIYPINNRLVDFNVSQEEIQFVTNYVADQTFDVDQVNKTITYNGTTKSMTNTPLAIPAGHANIPLCTYQNEVYPTNNGWIGKVYYVKMYDNGELVRDFIPVRVGNVGYMYDKVSRMFFGNAGSGSFILGSDV